MFLRTVDYKVGKPLRIRVEVGLRIDAQNPRDPFVGKGVSASKGPGQFPGHRGNRVRIASHVSRSQYGLSGISGHADLVILMTFSPDGRTLASASYDKTIKLWDVSSGKLLNTLSGHTDFYLWCSLYPGREDPDFRIV